MILQRRVAGEHQGALCEPERGGTTQEDAASELFYGILKGGPPLGDPEFSLCKTSPRLPKP